MAQKLELDGDEVKLVNVYSTDGSERENHIARNETGKGFILGKEGSRSKILGRRLLSIPAEDAAMLRANRDLDWLAFELTGDRNALRRLVRRFPYWQVCEGGF
jgi:hypothetical protein